MRRFLLTIAATLLCGAPACAAPSEDARAILTAADSALQEAIHVAPDNPDRARALYEEAAGGYETLIETGGVRSSAAYRALGSARLLSGDVGRGVLNLRRAERLDPRDRRTRATLDHARALVRTQVSPGVRDRALDVVLFWRGVVPRSLIFAVFIGSFVAIWCVASMRVIAPGVLRGPWVIALGATAAIAIGSLLAERAVFASARSVVVIDETLARTGPSEDVYAPAFENAISPGVEATAREQRDGWVRLRLGDGREGWVPESAVAWVFPGSWGTTIPGVPPKQGSAVASESW